jgi:hypothetical protein
MTQNWMGAKLSHRRYVWRLARSEGRWPSRLEWVFILRGRWPGF